MIGSQQLLSAAPRPSAAPVSARRPGFTLIEMLAAIAIIGILSSMVLVAMYSVQSEAKSHRTRSQILRIDQFISTKYESYKTRPLPLKLPRGLNTNQIASLRLRALRLLMRLELPERITDIPRLDTNNNLIDGPILMFQNPITNQNQNLAPPLPSLTRNYMRRRDLALLLERQRTGNNNLQWSPQHQSSECLYLILSAMRDGDSNALDYFNENEIVDTDGDGMKEILDGFGQPIEFLRWAPGFRTWPGPDGEWGIAGTDDDGNGVNDNPHEAGATGSDDFVSPTRLHVVNGNSPDPFDPLRRDPRWRNGDVTYTPIALVPLIYSAGPDREYGIFSETGNMPFRYGVLTQIPNTQTSLRNDPYAMINSANLGLVQFGFPFSDAHLDNLTNHNREQ